MGENKNIMKNLFSLISRLVFSHSKFLLMLITLSSLSFPASSEENKLYAFSKCNNSFIKAISQLEENNYNIRSKKFNNYLIYSEHSRKMISLEKYFKFNSNSIKCLSKNNQFAHKYNKKIFSKFYITKEKA